MGGYGSGRYGWVIPKETVEDCRVLSSAQMQSEGIIGQGISGGGRRIWRRSSTGEEMASISYCVNMSAGEPPRIWLQYTKKRPGKDEREYLDYPVSLTSTPLPWGGVRWWFECPLRRNGQLCGRRVGKLYLPPGGRYFGCRQCHDLTYTSCQESHKFDSMYRVLAAEMKILPEMIKRALKPQRE